MLKMVWIYAISSLTSNYIYVGMTTDLEARIERHNKGREKTTKPYLPFELIFTESRENWTEGRKREKYWKSGVGKEQLRKLKTKK